MNRSRKQRTQSTLKYKKSRSNSKKPSSNIKNATLNKNKKKSTFNRKPIMLRDKLPMLNCMVNDTLSDMLTRIRNAQTAKHNEVSVFNTKTNKRVAEILYKEGYINSYKISTVPLKNGLVSKQPRQIILYLKYLTQNQIPCISKMQRLSSPGLRIYSGYKEIPKVINGMGIVIVTTSQGVLTDNEARRKKIGGEILCSIY